jgi:hypothetical protein
MPKSGLEPEAFRLTLRISHDIYPKEKDNLIPEVLADTGY